VRWLAAAPEQVLVCEALSLALGCLGMFSGVGLGLEFGLLGCACEGRLRAWLCL
jgi:hypothetical protein